VLVALKPVSGPIAVEKPAALSTDRIDCERIALGAADDYKPCVAQLPGGELLLTAGPLPTQTPTATSATNTASAVTNVR
jgi:hypothetical protein